LEGGQDDDDAQIEVDVEDDTKKEFNVKDIGEEEEDEATAAEYRTEGIPIEPFNLKQELTEGFFDKNGHYIEHTNKDLEDPWYDEVIQQEEDANKNKREGVTKKKAVRFDPAAEKRLEQKAKEEEEATRNRPFREDYQGIRTFLVSHLQPQENVLQALRRLKKKPSSSLKADDQQQKANTILFNQITEAADICLAKFTYYIYHDSREKMLEDMKKDVNGGGSDQTAEDSGIRWEYKLSADTQEVFGPYTTQAMIDWAKQGYFQGDSKVLLRQVGEQDFQSSENVNFLNF